jgi:tetrahydromethanopterin S-methyltransferase subunit G
MNKQDFNALLDSLDRISKAIEGKKDNCAAEIVNRFDVVFIQLKDLEHTFILFRNAIQKRIKMEKNEIVVSAKEIEILNERLKDIIETYNKIIKEILNKK